MSGIRFSNNGILKSVNINLPATFLNSNGAILDFVTAPAGYYIAPVSLFIYNSVPWTPDPGFGTGDRINFQINTSGDPFCFFALDGIDTVGAFNRGQHGFFSSTPGVGYLYDIGTPASIFQAQMVNTSGLSVSAESYINGTLYYTFMPLITT